LIVEGIEIKKVNPANMQLSLATKLIHAGTRSFIPKNSER